MDSPELCREAGRTKSLPRQWPEPMDHLLGDLASLRLCHQAPEGLPESVQLSSSAADSPSASHAHFSGDRPAFFFSPWLTLGWICNLTVTMETQIFGT